MRHRVAFRKLGRVTEHRIAMLRNQAIALITHEHLRTTVPRAKELRPFVEHLITTAKRGDVHARRLVARDIADPAVVQKLVDRVAPRFSTRHGGYTRLLRLGPRRGDNCEMALVEFIGSEYKPKEKTEKGKGAQKAGGVAGRLRKAAERIRGRRAELASAPESEPVPPAVTPKPRGRGKKPE